MSTPPNIDLDKKISLRIHFTLKSRNSPVEILKKAAALKANKNINCSIKIVDHHLWFGVLKKHQKLYSPNLHIELEENEDCITLVNAKFGPDPALWTLFMFLHFGLAIVFITFAILTYANYSLGKAFNFHLAMMGLVCFCWIGLYFFARINRSRGKLQAKMLLNQALKII